MRYQEKQLETGWTVWDTETNAPAVLDGKWHTQLGNSEARNLALWLNKREARRANDPPPEEDLGGGDICSLQEQPSTEDDKPLD